MKPETASEAGPGRPRLTHIALRVSDLESSIAWYEKFTPFAVLQQSQDEYGVGAWLADPLDAHTPFVLVLSQFNPETDPFAYAPPTILGPFAHLGFELTSRDAVDEAAAQAEADGTLTMAATQMPAPIGYICFMEDPDGNTIEFSYGQGTYQTIADVWGDKQ